MSRILVAPDLHCWYEGPGPAEARIEEWHRCANTLLESAKERECSLALFPGDYFTGNRPSPAQVLAVTDLFGKFNAAGIGVIGIAGNHDVAAPGQPNFVDVVGIVDPWWGITEPKVIELPICAIACLPWVKGATDEHLSAILHGLVAQLPDDRPRIVLAHYATDASTYSSGESPVGRESVLRLAELRSLPVDLVVLGHIHKPQDLWHSLQSSILHPGALTRRDFGEEHDERRFAIYDTGSRRFTTFPLPARRFVTLNPEAGDAVDGIADAYVRIVYRATEEEAARVDHGELIRLAQDAGAFHVVGVFPDIIRSERSRAEDLTETTNPLAALNSWLALHTDLSEDLRARVRVAATELLEEVSP